LGGRFGRKGVITAIFKESQLKFLDTEKEPLPPSLGKGKVWMRIPSLLTSLCYYKDGCRQDFIEEVGTKWGLERLRQEKGPAS
jgi:hypothetical protein